MMQYLNEVKVLVDHIAAAGAQLDPEEIIIHIINGLPPAYQSFKTYIRTMTNPLSLDQLYSLLISEEIHIAADNVRFASMTDQPHALFVNRGRGRRSRTRPPVNSNPTSEPPSAAVIQCQICLKKGHTATDCWHRSNLQYVPRSTKQPAKALLADSNQSHTDWYLDSGASAHMTRSLDNLSISAPYQGSDGIVIGDGSSVNIANSGRGLLPTPSRYADQSRTPSGTLP
ncbi:hypothetical protein MA16_Dca004166 [Dendrobium catenatum]|uniref:Retrovirus-related Pol polyprotein from transposon TNT 1-94 n=1 Tax=Dendrobium catenatum TaxID=906689 RepID=A0A2I0X2K0_9ASPA|nr:hypothetical protein MA16_Dca004166 [Dendrobium catenatum]